MGFRCTRDGYWVGVDGIFLDRTRYAIHAVVRYLPEASEAERQRLTPEAQVDLLFAIVGESERGRARGARLIYVAVEGDRELAGFFRVERDSIPPELVA